MGSGSMSSYMDRAGSGGLSHAGSGMLGRPGLAGYPLPIGPATPRINACGYGPTPALHLRRALLLPPILASPGGSSAQLLQTLKVHTQSCLPRWCLRAAAAKFQCTTFMGLLAPLLYKFAERHHHNPSQGCTSRRPKHFSLPASWLSLLKALQAFCGTDDCLAKQCSVLIKQQVLLVKPHACISCAAWHFASQGRRIVLSTGLADATCHYASPSQILPP